MRSPFPFFVSFFLGLALSAQQPQVDLLNPAGKVIEVPPPAAANLDGPDARHVLELQRNQYFKAAEWERKQKEALAAEKEYTASEKAVNEFLVSLQGKYKCGRCDLLWDMRWSAPQGTVFAPKKPEVPQEKTPE